jgi:hypothetical protein
LRSNSLKEVRDDTSCSASHVEQKRGWTEAKIGYKLAKSFFQSRGVKTPIPICGQFVEESLLIHDLPPSLECKEYPREKSNGVESYLHPHRKQRGFLMGQKYTEKS